MGGRAGAIGLVQLGWFFTPSPLSLSVQFTLVGVFGETPEPAVAVDAISTAPCGGENQAPEGPDRSERGGGREGQGGIESMVHVAPISYLTPRELSSV